MKNTARTSFIPLLLGVFLVFSGCNKNDNPSPDKNGSYYLTTDVGGSQWEGNKIGALYTTIQESQDNEKSVAFVLVGIQIHDQDTSVIYISFLGLGQNEIEINKPFPFTVDNSDVYDTTNIAFLIYKENVSDSTTTYISALTKDEQARGSVTFTQIDLTKNIVKGVFSTTVTSPLTSKEIIIKNGKFNAHISSHLSEMLKNIVERLEG